MKTWMITALGGLLTGVTVSSMASDLELSASAKEVGRYEKIEFRISSDRSHEDPYDPAVADLSLLVRSPSGRAVIVPAFFAQDYEIRRSNPSRGGKVETLFYPVGMGGWKARFAPSELGDYRAQVQIQDSQGRRSSSWVTFKCVKSSSKGFLRVGRKDPRFFEFDNGEHFFVIGQNLAFIGEGQYVNLAKADEIFGRMAVHGANYARIWTCCKDWAMSLEGRKSAWSRSWSPGAPLGPIPGDERGRQCLKLEEAKAALNCSPSHGVALRPGTRYVLSGRFMANAGGALELTTAHGVGQVRFEPEKPGQWTPFERTFSTRATEDRLGRLSVAAAGQGPVYLDGLSLTEAGGGPELLWEADVNRPVRGIYNQLDCAMLDELVTTAERHGIYLMLCVVNRDLYMESLSKVGSAEYDQATADTKKFLRYCVARWGHSTAVGAWEYFNEMDPGKPTDVYYEELGRYLEEIDVYRHLRTTSTWHPSARDIELPQLDIGQLHHYMRPQVEGDYKDEVAVLMELSAFLRKHGPAKPVLIGEFGLATPKWGLSTDMKTDENGVHFRRSLWASAFAGSSGTAMFWWWDQLDRQDVYRHYKPLAAFLRDVSFAGLKSADASASDPVRVLGYQGEARAYLWLSDARATWHATVIEGHPTASVTQAELTVRGLDDGGYALEWWDTQAGRTIKNTLIEAKHGVLKTAVPPFSADIACRLECQP